ncbi:MAG: type II secretion system F family protein, partial [Gammaproteobacteria bacterium]|nr:type II secretion system F family protein [Gammaproteobacteria bacterium]
SYFFERDINERMDKMEPVLQTALLVAIGSVVLWLILSVFGPMYDTISTIDF